MSVDPGFGGQEFIEGVLPKVRRLRAAPRRRGPAGGAGDRRRHNRRRRRRAASKRACGCSWRARRCSTSKRSVAESIAALRAERRTGVVAGGTTVRIRLDGGFRLGAQTAGADVQPSRRARRRRWSACGRSDGTAVGARAPFAPTDRRAGGGCFVRKQSSCRRYRICRTWGNPLRGESVLARIRMQS